MKMPVKLSAWFLMLIVVSLHAKMEKGSAFYGFLEEPVSSRSLGMGGAGTALVNGQGFAFYNPALPALSNLPYLSFNYGRQYGDLGKNIVELGYMFPSLFVGLSFYTQSTGSFQLSDERGIMEGATATDQSSQISFDIGFKKSFYAIGLSVNGIQDKIAEYKSYGLTAGLGAVVTLIDNKLFTGVSVLNVGKNTSFLDSTHRKLDSTSVPVIVKGGISWTDTLKNKFPYTASADVVYSRNHQTVIVPVGVEFWLLPAFALRLGKRINFDTDLFSAGTGIRFENLQFDAAFTPTRIESDVMPKWSMGLTYSLRIKKHDDKKRTDISNQNNEKELTKIDTVKVTPLSSEPVKILPVEKVIVRKKTSDIKPAVADTIKKTDSADVTVIDSTESKFTTDSSEVQIPGDTSGVTAPEDSLKNVIAIDSLNVVKTDTGSLKGAILQNDSTQTIGIQKAVILPQPIALPDTVKTVIPNPAVDLAGSKNEPQATDTLKTVKDTSVVK
jgi:hypothetical protein